MLTVAVSVVLAVAASAGCSADSEPAAGHEDACAAEAGSATDVETEPDWRRHADYRPWTDADGCLQFVRDPNKVFGQPDLADRFVADDDLPADAVDSGYRRTGVSLWHVPGDRSQVWLVSGHSVERWPEGDPPICR